MELRCDAPAEVATDRIERRHKQGGDPSDATVEVATAMAAIADPWPSAVRIDTAGEIGAALARALEAPQGYRPNCTLSYHSYLPIEPC